MTHNRDHNRDHSRHMDTYGCPAGGRNSHMSPCGGRRQT